MGRPNGSEKAGRIVDIIIRAIDASRDEGVCAPDTQGDGLVRAYRGALFDERYRQSREGKWSYTPKGE